MRQARLEDALFHLEAYAPADEKRNLAQSSKLIWLNSAEKTATQSFSTLPHSGGGASPGHDSTAEGINGVGPDEQVRRGAFANIAGCAHEDIHIGMKVECRIEDADETTKLPFFYPAS